MTKTIFLFSFFLIFQGGLLAEHKCADEVSYLQQRFTQMVGKLKVVEGEKDITEKYKQDISNRVLIAVYSRVDIKLPQYIFFVDRNPSKQRGLLFLVDPLQCKTIFIGGVKVSTGNPNRRGYFATPLGFYKNSPENMSYRALGTKNSKGWRGLGVKNSRVWDFGWVETVNKNTKTRIPEPYMIRLLIHSTDPDHGEARLGTVDSKGCIRIPAKLNHFLDYFGILDADYEGVEGAQHVLLSEREVVCFQGSFVLVGDSR